MPSSTPQQMVDIHCHLLPAIDDGSKNLQESLRMAHMAVKDGIGTIIATPHQLGNFRHNTGDEIRRATSALQRELNKAKIPLRLLPGGDVRIDESITPKIVAGEVMSLGDYRRHVLLELPHEIYIPLEPVLKQLRSAGITGILSHPERNLGILRRRNILFRLVDAGCLMQVTAGSVTGTMGPPCQELSAWMLREGLVHFVATDAHGATTRRPLLRRAFTEVKELVDELTAIDLCMLNPACVASGQDVPRGRRKVSRKPLGWFGRRKAS